MANFMEIAKGCFIDVDAIETLEESKEVEHPSDERYRYIAPNLSSDCCSREPFVIVYMKSNKRYFFSGEAADSLRAIFDNHRK